MRHRRRQAIFGVCGGLLALLFCSPRAKALEGFSSPMNQASASAQANMGSPQSQTSTDNPANAHASASGIGATANGQGSGSYQLGGNIISFTGSASISGSLSGGQFSASTGFGNLTTLLAVAANRVVHVHGTLELIAPQQNVDNASSAVSIFNNGGTAPFSYQQQLTLGDVQTSLAVDDYVHIPAGSFTTSIGAGADVAASGTASTQLTYSADASADMMMSLLPLGDASGNGKVGFEDLLILAQHYGQGGTSFPTGDFDGNGVVDFQDLLILAQNYGQSTTAAAGAIASVPEPQALATVVPALLVCGMRRRRVTRRGSSPPARVPR